MAGVERVTFTTGGLLLPGNKENSTFCWQDPPSEPGSTDFFDQYVELGGSDSESPGGGGSGLGQLCGASEVTTSPQPSVSHLPLADGAGRVVGAVTNPQGGLLRTGITNSSGSSASWNAPPTLSAASFPRPRPGQRPLYPGTQNMAGYGNPEIDLDGGPSATVLGEARSGGGSISDSELLKLEGLTMRSPRVQIPHPSASVPASPPSQSPSPRKAGRLQEFCARIRNKTAMLHGKRQQLEAKLEPDSQASFQAPIMSTAQMEPVKTRPQQPNSDLSKPLPLSPPLANAVPGPSNRPVAGSNLNGSAGFVNGFPEDPFLQDDLPSGQFVPPFQLSGSMPHTPLQTPLLDGMPAWHLPLSTPNNKPLWTSTAPGAYFPVINGGVAANGWWDPSADAMDTDPPPVPLPLSYPAAANARSASLNLAIQLEQTQQGFEYPAPPGTEGCSLATSGLMIHMPQPRTATSAVLHSDRPTRADHYHRRPKPRAPSSGARHQHYNPDGAGLSPRKTRAASGATRGATDPVPPSPTTPGPSRGRLHRRSASMQTLTQTTPSDPTANAIRKRRSWTGRRTTISASSSTTSLHHHHSHGSLSTLTTTSSSSSARKQHRTPSSASTTATTATPHNHHSRKPTSSATAATVTSGPSGASGDGFVNYTPQDRTLLMTGVAPSGSSKTKARREKEAAERQREFRDRLARMVQAAGGDVSKLSGELEGVGVGGGGGGGGGGGKGGSF
ncbi:Regulatory protein wetA [Madurella fahalii]|uniref:Regulatory protein wetA n=1 Tax=Madurella fahalii TaxID=1157608 RepID=A0ABQ0G848_9PEZI